MRIMAALTQTCRRLGEQFRLVPTSTTG